MRIVSIFECAVFEQIEEAIYGAKGSRAVVAKSDGGSGGGDGGGGGGLDETQAPDDDEEEAAIELLRRRYADNQARKEIESALQKLEVVDSGGTLPADAGDGGDACGEPEPEAVAVDTQEEEEGPPDDSWMMASARAAARKALTPEERAAKDEQLYDAAGAGNIVLCGFTLQATARGCCCGHRRRHCRRTVCAATACAAVCAAARRRSSCCWAQRLWRAGVATESLQARRGPSSGCWGKGPRSTASRAR